MVHPRVKAMVAGMALALAAVLAPAAQAATQATIDAGVTTYVQGSGQSIAFSLDGPVPSGGQVLAIAWSDAQQSMVSAFHPTMNAAPWVIPSSALDLLPTGKVDIQLLVQSSTGVVSKTDHWITVSAPPPPTTSSLGVHFAADAPATYQQGSGVAIKYAIDGTLPSNGDVLVLAWSDDQKKMVTSFAYTMNQGPWQISAAKMDSLPTGKVQLQLLLRVNNVIKTKATHWVTISAAPTPTPAQPTTVSFPSDAPAQYTQGSGQAVDFNVSGPLPSGGDVLVQAWSYSQNALVPGFAHTLTQGPWQIQSSWLDAMPAGKVQLQLLLRSTSGSVSTVQQKAVHDLTIQAASTSTPPPSTTGPQIDSVTGLQNGDVVTGKVTVQATITNGVPNRVGFYVFQNGKVVLSSTDSSSPYTATFDTSQLAAGTCTLYVDAYPDSSNTASDTMPIQFSVQAASTTPPPPTTNPGPGWTNITKSSDTRVVYVSSSQGSDSNNGLSADFPVKTVAKGMSLIRDGHPDWLLFKRGDTFTSGLGYLGKSGVSQTQPIVFGNYGDPTAPRPWFKLDGSFLNVFNSTPSHLAFIGLRISDYARDPNGSSYNPNASAATGLRWVTASQDVLIENCMVEWFRMGIVVTAGSNIRLRRDVVRDCYSSDSSDSSGAYLGPITNLLVEGCMFYHNGWKSGQSRAIRRHGVYTYNVHHAVIRNNIFAMNSAFGLKIKGEHSTGASTDIQVTNNLFLGDGDEVTIGQNGEINYSVENVTLSNNAFSQLGANMVLQSGTIANEGLGLETKSIANGTFNNNIFVNTPGYSGRVIWALNVSDWRPQKNITMSNNIVAPTFHYSKGPFIGPSNATMSNNVVVSNGSNYVDASRNVGTYEGTLGGPSTLQAFLNEAQKQRKGNWRTAYTPTPVIAYLRAGLTLK